MPNSVSSRLHTALVAAFRAQLGRDRWVVGVGHLLSLALVAILIRPDANRVWFDAWMSAVIVTTIARALWQASVGRGRMSDAAVVRGTAVFVLGQGAAWGVGAALIVAATLPLSHTALVLLMFAGILASATNTLVADRVSMRLLLVSMVVPVLAGLAAGAWDADELVAVLMVVGFAGITLLLHSRAHQALIDRIEMGFELEDSEARFRRIAESSIIGICLWDRTGRVSEANDEILRIAGWTRDEVREGRVTWSELTLPEEAAADAETLQAVLEGASVPLREREIRRRDGTRVPLLFGLAPLREPGVDGVAFALDLTKRRKAEGQARWRAALLDAQLHASEDGVLIVDDLGRKVLQNARLNELWRIPPAIAADEDDRKSLEFVLESLKDPVQFRSRVEHLYAHRTEVGRDEVELRDGTTLYRYSAPVTGPGGEYYGRIWTFHDVTEHKRFEAAMREARELAERAAQTRSMFLANMSHEIRTPMNAVLGMVEIMLDSELSAEQRHSLEVVRSSGESLLAILNDILDYSKIEADRIDIDTVAFDLPHLVYSTAALLAVRAREKDLELIPDVGIEVPQTVRGDPTRVRQVLTNLVGNAVKFTEKGEVVVSVRAVPAPDQGAAVRFSVRDTGIGIAADRLTRIFEEFVQADGSTSRRYGGTGLGLTIAQRLVCLMGGRIEVTSEPGRGSEFSFTLPLPVEAQPPAAAPAAPVALGGRRILIVDDNATNRRVFRGMLAGEGALVDEAPNAAAGLASLRAGAPYALALIDVNMPGEDGFAMVSRIREDAAIRDTPILVLTSGAQRGDAARCRELGVAGYLTKPVPKSDLLDAVAAILGEALPPRERPLVTKHTLAEQRQPLRILLAEDVVVNQEVAVTMLRRRGHTVDIANNGREAVEAARAAAYDVILMDIQMPEMDGLEATAAIRALGDRGRVPIVALTAHALPGERERCLSHGMDGYLAKPFKAHELYAAVEGSRIARAAVTAEPAAGFDLEPLRQTLRDAGAEDALDHIVDTFLAEAGARVAAVRGSLASGTEEAVARAAHAFKSSAGAIGATALATLLARIEAAAKARGLSDRRALAEQVDAAAAAVSTALRAYRDRVAV